MTLELSGAAGHTPLWGDDALVDHRRLRALARRPSPHPETSPWEGFLWYAGRILDGEPLFEVPASLVSIAGAAVASVSGYERALELVAERSATKPFPAPALATGQRLAMRCALRGAYSCRILRWLLPRSDAAVGKEGGGDTRWLPALLALDAYREKGCAMAVATLVAALAATKVRERLNELGRQHGFPFPHLPWAGAALTADERRQAAVSLVACRRRGDGKFWPGGAEGPRLHSWPSPDLRWLETRLAQWTDGDLWTAREVLLCDGTAVAAILGLMGHGPRAGSYLDAADVPDWLWHARAALAEAIRTYPMRLDAFWREPADRHWHKLRELARATEDPSVLLGTPHWLLPEGRGRLTTRLLEKGHRLEARKLASVLDHAAVRTEAQAFWLLGDGDTRAVLELAEWLAARLPPPADHDARVGLEGVGRGFASEEAGVRA